MRISDLTMKSVCVTGGGGFIGRRLVGALRVLGLSPRILTRQKPDSDINSLYFVGDLVDGHSSLAGLVSGVDVVFHCAGEVKNTSLMRTLHVDGTARLLEEVRRQINASQKPVHWVQLSSVGAYGPPQGAAHSERIVVETTPCVPVGEYEITKTLSDQLVEKFAETEPLFSFCILRPSNVVGPTMSNQSLRALVRMIEKRIFFYIGSRHSVATYVHVDDVVAALVLCGTHANARGQVFNLSNDCLLSEIVDAVCLNSSLPPPNLCVPEYLVRGVTKLLSSVVTIPLTQERIDALVKMTYYPTRKIEKCLGFKPDFSIPAAIAAMF